MFFELIFSVFLQYRIVKFQLLYDMSLNKGEKFSKIAK